jgi:hypothetical protein
MPNTGQSKQPNKVKKPKKKKLKGYNSIINTEDIINHSSVQISSQIMDTRGYTAEDDY